MQKVILTNAGGSKLYVIKAIKNSLGIGLKEAKELVASAPCELIMPSEKAAEVVEDLKQNGADIEFA